MNISQISPFPWLDILEWYRLHGRHDLPWRMYSSYHGRFADLLYSIWLSEIFLQQTQVERVIPYLEKVLSRFPDIRDLAATDYETFFPYYQGLGYYSRARNILKTAKIIAENHEGVFPSDEKILSKLPGVGPYTLSAIQSFGYGMPVLAWDTNLDKVFSRYYHGRRDISLSENEKEIVRQDFRNFIENTPGKKEDIIRDINNGLMDFARIIDNKNPERIIWESYPLQSGLFYETRGAFEPVITKKVERFPTADAHIVVILHEGHKVYYSSIGEKYAPYILRGVGENDTRGYVQKYFREKYRLELSVRPIHKKWMGEDNIPYVAVHAQIQTGNLDTKTYKKEDITSDLLPFQK